MKPPDLILASASPRRSELLRQIGVRHRVQVANVIEQRAPGETVEQCVRRLAEAKARAVALTTSSSLPVLGADTAVVVDDHFLGKPTERDAALGMLAQLSGRSHRVLTAVALWHETRAAISISESIVTFRTLSRAECERYWDSGEPRDKAGAYAIQGLAAEFIAELRGSYSGVMGLPLFETAELLRRAAVPLWQDVTQ
jgi:septum formation protein